MKIHVIKNKTNLSPMYQSDINMFRKLKEGLVYIVEIKSDRNYRHHKKLFAICKMIIDNLDDKHIWANKEAYQLIKAIEHELGYVVPEMNLKGEIKLVPESISFENWPQDKFEQFYDKAIPLLTSHFDYEIEVLENNYDAYL